MYIKGEYKILLLGLASAALFYAVDSYMTAAVLDQEFHFWDLFIGGSYHHGFRRFLIFIFFIIYAAVIARVYRHKRRAEIENRKACEELRAHQEQLRAANQQLAAGEQQINATEQQLKAMNQQLTASNQQLVASESALRAERDLTRQYLDVASVMLIALDSKGLVSLINPKGCEILETTGDKILGSDWFNTFIPEESRKQTRGVFNDIMQGETDLTEHYRNSIITPDGKEKIISWHNSLILGEDGKPAGTLSSGSDITDFLASESREAQLKEKLTRAQRLESLGVLAGGVAHDLNNILTPMVALPDIMLEELNDLHRKVDVAGLIGDVKHIKHTGRIASDIIRDLLTLSRRGHYTLSSMSINALIEQFSKSPIYTELEADNPAVEFSIDLSDNLPAVLGSESHLTQVLMNLCINAAESMAHGGELTVSTSTRSIASHSMRYEVIEEGEYIVISIRDTGAGINESDLEHIFEPFYTRKKMGLNSGTGLGLSVVYGVIKDHNGYIDVATEVGKGTEFTIYIPATDEDTESGEEHNIVTGGSETLMIVDDVEGQRELARRILERYGYRVKCAASGREAVKRLQESLEDGHQFDLILLDMIMEDDFDGLDTYNEIKNVKPAQKCIIMSGYSETDRVRKAIDRGVGHFLAKPYTSDKLLALVRSELDG